ncbi:MAG: metallophosphoesterase [Chlorobi bacterium]|nr:metallophosphoesterase [Chlorobiota bacterium]
MDETGDEIREEMGPRRRSRRAFLGYGGLAGAVALAVDGLFIEPGNVEFTHHELGTPVAGGRPFRFAQLTDLHLSSVGEMHREIAETIGGLDLDFLLITGDAIDDNYHLGALDQFMGLFRQDLPKYAVLGNWEHWGKVRRASLEELYKRRNCDLLVNRTVTARAGDREILITGLDDSVAGIPSPEFALEGIAPGDHHILLAHSPSYRDYLLDYNHLAHEHTGRLTPPIDFDSYGVKYIFSGHTHGGQVNLLGITPFLPKGCGRYLAGWYRERAPCLYVSRGIGTSILPMRIGARPEVAVFTMWG